MYRTAATQFSPDMPSLNLSHWESCIWSLFAAERVADQIRSLNLSCGRHQPWQALWEGVVAKRLSFSGVNEIARYHVPCRIKFHYITRLETVAAQSDSSSRGHCCIEENESHYQPALQAFLLVGWRPLLAVASILMLLFVPRPSGCWDAWVPIDANV